MFRFLCCGLCFCIVLRIVSPPVHNYLFSICVQFYRPLPLGGNQTAVNKYHITPNLMKICQLLECY